MSQSRIPMIALFWVLSFLFALPLIKPYALARLGAVAFVFLAFLLAAWQYNKAEERRPLLAPLPVLLILFFLWAAASLLWTEIFHLSYFGLWRFFLLPGSFLIFLMAGTPPVYRSCAIGAGAILAALAFWALFQFMFLPHLLVGSQVRAPFANPNIYAALMALGFLPGLGLMFTAQNRRDANWLLLYCSLVLSAAIILSGRGVIMALCAATAFFLWVNRRHLKQHKRCGLALIFVAAVSFALPYMFRESGTAVARLVHLAEEPEFVAGTRLAIWQGAWEIIKGHPFLGTGMETFAQYYPEYRPAADRYSGGLMAHNDPLQFWVELGLPGILLFYAIVLLYGVYMIKTLRRMPPGAPERIVPSACFAGLGAVVLHSHIDFDFYSAAILPLFGMILAVWYTRTVPAAAPQSAGRKSRIACITLVCLALGNFVLLQGLLRADHMTGVAAERGMRGEGEGYLDAINAAHRAGYGLHPVPYILAASVPLAQLETQGFMLTFEEADALFRQTAYYLDRAEALNPRDPRLYFARANLYRFKAEQNKAEEDLRKTLALSPQHAAARQMLAGLYEFQGDSDKAWDILLAGVDVPYPDFDPRNYYNQLLALAEERGEVEVAAQVRERLEKYSGRPTGAPDPSAPAVSGYPVRGSAKSATIQR